MYWKCASVWVCYSGSVSDGEVSGWRAASSVNAVAKTNVKKMRADADWTERTLAIKGEMKTNGQMIGRGDGKQMRRCSGGWWLEQ